MVCQLISFPNTNLHHFLSVGTSYERRSQKVVQLSQSFQSAPFNDQYTFSNSSPAIVVANPKKSQVNSYKGAAFQQATSVVTDGNRAATQLGSLDGSVAGGEFSTFGTEFTTGPDGEATWVSDGEPSWTLTKDALAADPVSQIGPRVMASEPSKLEPRVETSRFETCRCS